MKPLLDWGDVIFWGKNKYNIFCRDCRDIVWRIINTELEKKKIKIIKNNN